MQTAIYARVSSESQAREGTIQSQLEVLREYAKLYGDCLPRRRMMRGQ